MSFVKEKEKVAEREREKTYQHEEKTNETLYKETPTKSINRIKDVEKERKRKAKA